ncbi:Hypothetical protein A7982_10271 [Minicystis rosea]|nr:Hypothetical protein A7982_10271 [Minicystis rosea]
MMRFLCPVLALGTLLGCVHDTSSAEADPTCVAKCAAEHAFSCAPETACLDTCARTLAAESACSSEIAAYTACYGEHRADLSGCYTQDACVVAFGNYLFCADAICTTTSCDHPDGTCTCAGTCSDHDVKSVCTGAECRCLVDGEEVGTCTDGSMPICGLKESCCTALYFLSP